MGAVARRARRRASGALTLTRPRFIAGGLVIGAGGPLPGVAPGCGLGGGGRVIIVAAGRGRACGGDGQQRPGAHGQDGAAVEGVPQPDLVLVQAGLPPAQLEAFLYWPSLPGDPDQDGQGTARPAGAWQ